MKKIILAWVAVVALFAAFAVSGVSAAPGEARSAGPYEGTFNGTIYGSNGSSAPITIVATHRGSDVDGTIFLGEGLVVDAGFCGKGALPATAQAASGETSARNPKHLEASSTFNVSGQSVTVYLESDVSGDVLSAEARIDVPWVCGRDPVLTGKLYRQ